MNRRVTLAIRILVICVIAAALWWFARNIDFAELGKQMRSALLWPLVLAAACFLGEAGLRERTPRDRKAARVRRRVAA